MTSVAAAALHLARKTVVAVIGFTVLAAGVTLILLPGPAILVIPLGLSILAREFLWARRLLRLFRDLVSRVLRRTITKRSET